MMRDLLRPALRVSLVGALLASAPAAAQDRPADAVDGPAGHFLTAGPCPMVQDYRGESTRSDYRPPTQPRAQVYDTHRWICDWLGERWVRIADGRALGGGCRIQSPPPAAATSNLCTPSWKFVPSDGGRLVATSPVAVGPATLRVARGDYLCPSNYVPMPVEAARAIDQLTNGGLCDYIGDSPVRLVPRGVMGGRNFGCRIDDALPQALTATLCVRAEQDLPQIFPDAGDRPTVFEYAAVKADGTPLAKVYFSFEKTPGGWAQNHMIWDAPAPGASVWVPDGRTAFKFVPVARHETEALPKLSPGRRAFDNRGKDVVWTHEPFPIVPQYRIVEHGKAGMSVLADGTMRFYSPQVTGTLFADPDKTVTFVPNEGAQKLVVVEGYSVDDAPKP